MCDQHSLQEATAARELNFLGIDLSRRAVRYASGISTRWGFRDKCVFQYGDCLSGLEWVREHYSGPVVLVLINFPTPYHIRNIIASNHDDGSGDDGHTAVLGNVQLFDSLESFMCNTALFSSIAHLFNKLRCPDIQSCLFLQSNVEDVAVTMRNTVQSSGDISIGNRTARFDLPEDMLHARSLVSNIFHASPNNEAMESIQQQWVTSDQLIASTNITAGGGRLSQRLQLWLDYLERWGGDSVSFRPDSRACGVGWLPESLLPYGARTETEAHCEFECKPVHRMLFVHRSYHEH